jgi:hypothetical protein
MKDIAMIVMRYFIFKGMLLFPEDCFSYVVSGSGGEDVFGSDVGVDSSVGGISVVVTDVALNVVDTVLLVG